MLAWLQAAAQTKSEKPEAAEREFRRGAYPPPEAKTLGFLEDSVTEDLTAMEKRHVFCSLDLQAPFLEAQFSCI